MKILNKLQADVFGHMVQDETIAPSLASGIKKHIAKVGATAVLMACTLFSTGMAHAGNGLWQTVAGGAVAGMVTNNTRPADANCNVEGTNGWKVAGGSAIGAVLGNQVGSGSGQVAATIVGALIGGSSAKNSENNRMRQACNPPTRYGTTSYPQEPILYDTQNDRGQPIYVTPSTSPGIAALQGRLVSRNDVSSDPIADSAMQRSYQNMVNSYRMLEDASRNYVQNINTRTTNGKLGRYAVDSAEVNAAVQNGYMQQQRNAQAFNDLNSVYTQYATDRSKFAQISDNAAMDGYNITRYGDALNYFTPPQAATVAYKGSLPNRFATIPQNYGNR